MKTNDTRRRISQRLVIVALALIALFAVDRTLLADIPTWDEMFPDDETLLLDVKTWNDSGLPGPSDDWNVIQVSAVRTPIISGACDVSASVVSDSTALVGISLMVADDLNMNGVIDPSEWVTVATAPAVPAGSGTMASLGPVQVSATKQAYRIQHNWTWGTSFDEVKDKGLL